MVRTGIKAALVTLTLMLSSVVHAQHADWSYEGNNGPSQWGDLPGYGKCKTGREQSPINLANTGSNQTTMPALSDYSFGSGNYPGPLRVHNNGHTIRVLFLPRCPGCYPGYTPPSWLTYNGVQYDLRELHFHAPSEHQVNGTSYPLEMHMVHQQWMPSEISYKGGKLLVIGVLFTPGAANETLGDLLGNLPAAGQTIAPEMTYVAGRLVGESIDYYHLLPGARRGDTSFKKEAYRYPGSLTTPGCDEGVNWIVLANPVTASSDQIKKLVDAMPKNNRPVQPLNDRLISPP